MSARFVTVSDNIARLQLPWKFFCGLVSCPCSVFLVKLANSSYVLVDPGMPEFASTVLEAVQRFLGCSISNVLPPQVSAILCTHGHIDHLGAAKPLLHNRPDLRVYVHIAEKPYCIVGGPPYSSIPAVDNCVYCVTKHILTENPNRLVDADVVGWDPTSSDSQPFDGIELIPAPGHTPGHMCILHAADGVLLAGDSFMHIHKPLSGPFKVSTPNMTAAKQTEEHLLTYTSWSRMYPSHDISSAADGIPRSVVEDFVHKMK